MQNQNDRQRNPFLDMGVLVSICVFIVMLIKSALFGFSWASIAWLVIVLAYWCAVYVFVRKNPDGRMLSFCTWVFLCASVIVLVSIAFVDKNARPKMHAFEGAATDSVEAEQEFVVDETPDITVVERADTVRADSMRRDSVNTVATSVMSDDVFPASEADASDEDGEIY